MFNLTLPKLFQPKKKIIGLIANGQSQNFLYYLNILLKDYQQYSVQQNPQKLCDILIIHNFTEQTADKQLFNNNTTIIFNSDLQNNSKIFSGSQNIIFYGFKDGANYQITDYKLTEKNGQAGIIFKIKNSQGTVPVFLPNITDADLLLPFLAVLIIGKHFALDMISAINILTNQPK